MWIDGGVRYELIPDDPLYAPRENLIRIAESMRYPNKSIPLDLNRSQDLRHYIDGCLQIERIMQENSICIY